MNQPKTSGLAIASLVTAVMGLGLIPVILGHIALSGIKKSNGTLGGKGLALAGLIIGYLTILAVLVIIVLAIVIGASAGVLNKGRENAAEAKLHMLSSGLDSYRVITGEYPSNEQGLEALVVRPSDPAPEQWQQILPEVPLDPWGHQFEYQRVDSPELAYAVWSVGPDGISGTSDDLRLAP